MNKNRIQRAVLAIILSIGVVFGFANVAHASSGDAVENALSISPFLVTGLISVVIPIINGWLTKLEDATWIKGLLDLILNAVNAFIVSATLGDGSALVTRTMFTNFVVSLVISTAAYSKVYKPIGLTSSSVAVPDPNTPGQVAYMPGKLAYVGPRKDAA